MPVENRATTAYSDQQAGTAGLRKKVAVFQQPGYLENYLQAIFDSVPALAGGTLVIGGDGRFHNDVAIQTAIQMAIAHGVERVLVGRDGLMSTPSASSLIREHGADGGMVFTASHNPAGPKGDFGIKFNMAGGGQATSELTEAFYRRASTLNRYAIHVGEPIDLAELGELLIADTWVKVIDPVAAYAEQMEAIFDFEQMRAWLRSGHRVLFDAMHAVTGPYAREILCERLGAPADSVINALPLSDFGGGHPDPNLIYAKELVDRAYGDSPPDLSGASDGDGDRNMILGPGMFVSPGDSLAMLAAKLHLIPSHAAGIAGVARSMPTSRAADRVAEDLGFECHETPTGWKFFCNLLDAGRVNLCGEESFGTSSSHTREKDGLWAFLAWMNVLAADGRSLPELAIDHWQSYGRHYYQRHDYEGLSTETAAALMAELETRLPQLLGQDHDGLVITTADNFAYQDPIDGTEAKKQGIRLIFGEDARIVVRLSGTGTAGATLRLYLERYAPGDADHAQAPEPALAKLAALAEELVGMHRHTGKDGPDLVT